MNQGPFPLGESSEPQADDPAVSTAVSNIAPEEAAGVVDRVDSNAALRAIEQQLAELREAFDAQLRSDARKDAQIDRLYQELETYKRNQRESPFQPIMNDLIAMYDDITKVIEKNQGNADAWSDATERSIKSFQQSIIHTLSRYGIESYQAEGDTYNSEQQRPVEKMETTDEHQDGKIERVRVGFRAEGPNGRIIRQEMVRVYRFVQQPN